MLIYSHDTFGLGHLRRARAIANALVADEGEGSGGPGPSVIIVSGSPVIGSFAFGPGVDYIRIPGVTKLADGDYRSLTLNLPLDEAVALREAIIRQTALAFDPDLFLVDKEPTGFHGEVLPTLNLLKDRGCRLVLGIRDVLDEPALLVPEWERKGAVDATALYDAIWVYGLEEVYRPLDALPLPASVRARITYTGYLRRTVPRDAALAHHPRVTRGPFLLATPGGGGDGEDLVDWVVSAYEADPAIPLPALVVFGPFFARDRRAALLARISRHPKLAAIAFDTRIERLMQKASGIVAMGGYNTFCEILSFDKPALIVPRTEPRREQLIRATAAHRLGLAKLLVPTRNPDPTLMAQALTALPTQARPSQNPIPNILSGLATIQELAKGQGRTSSKLAAE